MVKPSSQISPEIRSSDTRAPVVERANDWVAEITDTFPSPVSVEWHRVENDRAGNTFGLVGNEYGTSHGVFRSEDLANRATFQYQLNPVLLALTHAPVVSITRNMRASGPATGAG